MAQWFETLDILSRIFFCVAVPATLLLVLQLIVMIIGMGSDSSDGPDAATDTDGDSTADVVADGVDGGLRLFSLWGLITFFTVMGWSGFAMAQGGLSGTLAVPIALILGIIAMALLALLMRAMLSLQQNGAMNVQNALGHKGQVYLTIPPARGELGKVMLLVQDRYSEFSAVTDEEAPIPSGCEVEVIGITGANTLVVRTIHEGGKQAWSG